MERFHRPVSRPRWLVVLAVWSGFALAESPVPADPPAPPGEQAAAPDGDPADGTAEVAPSPPPIPKAPPRRLRPKTRRVANRRPSSEGDYGNFVVSKGGEGEEHQKAREDLDVDLRLGALAGVSGMNNNATDPSVVNVALEATADARFMKYFGVELDINGDLFPAKYNATANANNPTSKQIRGVMGNAKVQYVFYNDSVKFIPKLGIGYGFQSQDYVNPLNTTSGTATAGTDQLSNVFGVYGIGGVDVEIGESVVLFSDFAHSFFAQGTVASQTLGTVSLTDVNYLRFRIGGYYRMGPNWGLGTNFVYRSATYDSIPGAAVTTTGADSTQYQFLGLVMFELAP